MSEKDLSIYCVFELPFEISSSGTKRFSRGLAQGFKPIGLLLEIEPETRLIDFNKIFRDAIDRRSSIRKKLQAIPWIRKFLIGNSDFESVRSMVSIVINTHTVLSIPLLHIPSGDGMQNCYKIYPARRLDTSLDQTEVVLEWNLNPTVSKPVRGVLRVIGLEEPTC